MLKFQCAPRWIIVTSTGVSIYIFISLITGPTMFCWQSTDNVSNCIFLTIPFISYLAFYSIFLSDQGLFTGLKFSSKKYKNSRVINDKLDSIQPKLEDLIEDKIYTQPELSLQLLAEYIESDSHTVSRLINERYGKSFNNFMNSHRVNEFIRIVESGEHHNQTFLSIAYDVGFKNKTSFNNAFKKETGTTPRTYFNKKS